METTETTSLEIRKEDRKWLEQLQEKIWDAYGYVKRPITKVEFSKMMRVIRKYKLPTVIESDCTGFVFQFRVYNHPPVAGGIPPKIIFLFHANHVPTSVIQDCPPRKGNDSAVRDRVFFFMKNELFSQPWNLQLLEYYGLPLPGPRKQYTY